MSEWKIGEIREIKVKDKLHKVLRVDLSNGCKDCKYVYCSHNRKVNFCDTCILDEYYDIENYRGIIFLFNDTNVKNLVEKFGTDMYESKEEKKSFELYKIIENLFNIDDKLEGK